MNAEKLHDALNLLPGDLITETDRLRSGPGKRKVHRLRYWAMAACFGLVLCSGVLLFPFFFGMGGSTETERDESIRQEVQAPMAQDSAAAGTPAENAAAENGAGFYGDARTVDLMEQVPERTTSLAEVPDRSAEAADFGLRLLQNTVKEGENTLISPLSVLSALAMTANGAEGETLDQMEAALGMTRQDMNAYFYGYMAGLGEELKPANAIWFKNSENLSVKDSFLQANADFYGADLFKTPMDETTLKAINGWVREKTDGRIPEILEEIPATAMMYLVNALSFTAQWEEMYPEYAIGSCGFTLEDGTKQTVDMMYSEERQYLEDRNATGFLKYYSGRKYAFAALLPKEGVSVSAYVDSLTGEHLRQLLANPEAVTVSAGIPKFETGYAVEMSEILTAMGMTDAFDSEAADFSSMGSCGAGRLYISQVRHKTYIRVAEQGTEAGAATVVEMPAAGAYIEEEIKTVILDRPFVYMLIDCEQNLPIFIGTVMNAEG